MNQDFANKQKYVIGLVIYYPKKNLFKRVEEITQLGYIVYIFDNSPDEERYTGSLKKKSNIFYLTAGTNVGISYALSTICATARAHGHHRLLFLDQDTGISSNTLEFVSNQLQTEMPLTQSKYAALVFDGTTAKKKCVEDITFAISSGSLFCLHILKQIGWHNLQYFVDCVDYEFCLRAKRNGFRIGKIRNTPDFDHVSEQPDRIVKILGKSFLVRKYSTKRIRDSVKAYSRLIFGEVKRGNVKNGIDLVRSFTISAVGQILSRIK